MCCWGSVTSFKMAAKMAAMLDFSKNLIYRKNSEIGFFFFARAVKYDTIEHFAAFGCDL